MSTYKAQIEQDEDGRWSAWVEALPGCAVWGNTREEALAALEDAVGAYLEDMVEAGDTLSHVGEKLTEKPLIVV